MSDDLERRLRDTLRAYADVVQAPDDDSPPVRTETPPRRWRGAVLAAAAAAAVVVGALVVVDVRDRVPPADVAAGSSAPAERGTAAPSDQEGTASDQAMSAPADGSALAAAPVPGVSYPVDLSTHCGVRGLDVGGVWFAAEPPLVTDGGSPPAGWGDPDQPGTLTQLSATEAVFRDDRGHELRLHADESARPTPCD